MEKNRRKVIFRGEQDWRGEKFDGDEIPWLMKKFAGHALHVKLASRCFRLDFRIDEGSSSCLAAPHLFRARHARPLSSLRNSSFRLAAP
jgi:hypothetical protein